MKISSFSPSDRKQLKRFIAFPPKLYKDDPNYIRALSSELIGSKLLGSPGLLTARHPYHNHADTLYVMIEDGKDILGRIAATINFNHNKTHDEKTGFFGFFESINNKDISDKLFDAASEFLKEKGMNAIRGPASFTLNDICGLLVEGFDTMPYLDMAYNPSYYQDLIEQYGFTKVKDLLAYKIDIVKHKEDILKKLERIDYLMSKAHKRGRVTIRNADFNKAEQEFAIIRKIYNEAWKDNWGHDPLEEDEFKITAKNLKMIADPNMVYLGFYDNKSAAFFGIVPNINQLLQKHSFGNADFFRIGRLLLQKNKITTARMMLFGILPSFRANGIDALMFEKSIRYSLEKGIKEVEVSWLLEDNDMIIRPTEFLCGEKYKTYRMYEKKL